MAKARAQTANKKGIKISARAVTIIAGIAMMAITGIAGVMFSPGDILPLPEEKEHKKASMPIMSTPYGDEKVDISLPQKPAKKPLPKQFEAPFQMPQMPDFMNRIPTELPSMEAPQMKPPQAHQGASDAAIAAYAKHTEMTEGIGGKLSRKFTLDKISPAPTSPSQNKFTSAYVLLDDNESIERVDLMTIVRTEDMKRIKTAKDALKSLVEESEEVTILEATDEFLIYEMSGTKGYQVGKISLDDNGIYISGYVNLTTNRMPSFLKKEWIERLKPL